MQHLFKRRPGWPVQLRNTSRSCPILVVPKANVMVMVILTIAIMAVICGNDDFEGMEEFGLSSALGWRAFSIWPTAFPPPTPFAGSLPGSIPRPLNAASWAGCAGSLARWAAS